MASWRSPATAKTDSSWPIWSWTTTAGSRGPSAAAPREPAPRTGLGRGAHPRCCPESVCRSAGWDPWREMRCVRALSLSREQPMAVKRRHTLLTPNVAAQVHTRTAPWALVAMQLLPSQRLAASQPFSPSLPSLQGSFLWPPASSLANRCFEEEERGSAVVAARRASEGVCVYLAASARDE